VKRRKKGDRRTTTRRRWENHLYFDFLGESLFVEQQAPFLQHLGEYASLHVTKTGQ
jgi:hypothetical protein